MKSVVIAGCAGFLGSHLTTYLIGAGYHVVGIDDLSRGSIDYLIKDKNLSFYHAPIEEFEIAYPLFESIQSKYKPIAIYHFAGHDYNEISPFARFANYKDNIMISSNIINACMEYGWKIIFGSSSSVYGYSNSAPFKESMPTNPITPYDISKNAIELDIINSSKKFNFLYNILRIDNLIGEYFNPNPTIYGNLFQLFVKNVIDGKPIIINGDGSNKISFLDINFCLKPLSSLIDNSDDIILPDNTNQIFNLAGSSVCSVNQLADLILDVGKSCGYDKSYKIFEQKTSLPSNDRYCDTSKAQNMLGFADGTSLKQAAKKTFEWYSKNNIKNNKNILYEIENNMEPYFLSDKTQEMSTKIEETKKEFINNFNKKSTTIYGKKL